MKTEHLQAIQKEQKDPNMQMKVSVVEGLFLKKVHSTFDLQPCVRRPVSFVTLLWV